MADMKEIANNYEQRVNCSQPLDLSSSKTRRGNPVLDLSHAKDAKCTSKTAEPQMFVNWLPSPAHATEQYQQAYLSDEDRIRIFATMNRSLIGKDLKPVKMYERFCNNNNQIDHISPCVRGITLMNTAPLPSGGSMKIPTVTLPISTPTLTISTSPVSITSSSMYADPTLTSLKSIMCNRNIPPSLPTEFLKFASSAEMEQSISSLHNAKKVPRPFKAYSREMAVDYNSNERFLKYREQCLNHREQHKDAPNPKMRRASKGTVSPTSTVDDRDAAYRERRRKNNEAAKRSRDARRAKEDELAIKVVFLENENQTLKKEISKLTGISIEEINRTILKDSPYVNHY